METDSFLKIQDIEEDIRTLINRPRLQYKIMRQPSSWIKLCASLDGLGDTTIALSSYIDLEAEDISSYGIYYLVIYGVMQNLLVQQDAIQHINYALFEQDEKNIKSIIKKFPAIMEIRTIRNDSIGHAFSSTENKKDKNGFISRNFISKSSFELTTIYSDIESFGKEETKSINLPDIVLLQQEQIFYILEMIKNKLIKMDKSYRKKLREHEVFSLFEKEKIDYPISKIKQLTDSNEQDYLLKIHLNHLSKFLNNLQKKLVERGDWEIYPFFKKDFALINHAISRLNTHLQGDSVMENEDISIYGDFIVENLRILKQSLKELEDELLTE